MLKEITTLTCMTRPSMEKYQITLTLALFAYYHVNHYCLTQRVTIFDVNELTQDA